MGITKKSIPGIRTCNAATGKAYAYFETGLFLKHAKNFASAAVHAGATGNTKGYALFRLKNHTAESEENNI